MSSTQALVEQYPVSRDDIVAIVLDQWESIFESRVGRHGLRIGEHIRPKPQIMGDYLHELIPFEFQARFGVDTWRRDQSGTDKDLVYVENDYFSTEIKTSSHRNQVFGNRSYAQPSTSKKTKSGFYLTVNFEKWSDVADGELPGIRLIRLGWLDHTDWKAQASQSGQQARILPEAYAGKLVELYRAT
jgi:hypothetical protein